MTDDYGAPVRHWTDVVKRARLGRTVKAVAFLVATYADSDGSRVFPGIARLAVEAEVTYNVAQGALGDLRKAGLLELVRHGTRRGESDEYRLILGPDLMDQVEVRSPTEVSVAIEAMRNQRRGKGRQSEPDAPDPRPTVKGAQPVDNPSVHPTASGAPAVQSKTGAPHGDVPKQPVHPTAWVGAPHAVTPHQVLTGTQEPPTTPTTDLGTATHGPRATGDPPETEIVGCGCSRGYVLSTDGSTILRCPTCPPSNVIPLRRPA